MLAGMAFQAGLSAEPDRAQVVAGRQRWLDGTHDLQGEFEQILRSGALGAGIRESGRLWVERPGKMRWDYLDPENKIAILDGSRTLLWITEDVFEGLLVDGKDSVVLDAARSGPLLERLRGLMGDSDARAARPKLHE